MSNNTVISYDTYTEIINGLFIDLPDTVAVTRNPNEETSHQLRNMSEQELIQYFDRISQEEEN